MIINSVGKTNEWYTPKFIFDDFNTAFDLDVCSPKSGKDFVPAKNKIILPNDGLKENWEGFIWMNPPFGGRNGYFPWIEKFIQHGNGIGLITALTSSKGFQDYIPQMDYILFPRGKTKFIDEFGNIGKDPQTGIVIFSIGDKGNEILRKSKLGMVLKV